ncbi:MAG: hypothetical protein J6S85_00370 [Methanobrevibacter sp.]|nr:hypothetical protein [Methanobrevibacter sp.]
MTNQIYFIYFYPMDKLDKAREEICKDCMFGTVVKNCNACLYNILKQNEDDGM